MNSYAHFHTRAGQDFPLLFPRRYNVTTSHDIFGKLYVEYDSFVESDKNRHFRPNPKHSHVKAVGKRNSSDSFDICWMEVFPNLYPYKEAFLLMLFAKV